MTTRIPSTFNPEILHRQPDSGRFRAIPSILSTNRGLPKPTVALTAPYIPPADVIEAVSVKDMLSVNVPYDLDWLYEIGKVSDGKSLVVQVGNKCIANDIRITMSYPSFLTVDSPFPLIIPPLTIYNIAFTLRESDVKERVHTGKKNFLEMLEITTIVLNVSGPVYVKPQL